MVAALKNSLTRDLLVRCAVGRQQGDPPFLQSQLEVSSGCPLAGSSPVVASSLRALEES